MNKPFNLEAFKAGQKALTREGRIATFVGIYEDYYSLEETLVFTVMGVHRPMIMTATLTGRHDNTKEEFRYDLVSMVSRHQHLIDSYDPEDTWQVKINDKWDNLHVKPLWDEERDYRLHPHNDLIKAWKKGAKIEAYITGDWVEEPNPDWYEDTQYRIKAEPVTHCLAYDAKRFNLEHPVVHARVVKKEVAEATGWKIIQEWEV